eukprot:ctg_1387.g446
MAGGCSAGHPAQAAGAAAVPSVSGGGECRRWHEPPRGGEHAAAATAAGATRSPHPGHVCSAWQQDRPAGGHVGRATVECRPLCAGGQRCRSATLLDAGAPAEAVRLSVSGGDQLRGRFDSVARLLAPLRPGAVRCAVQRRWHAAQIAGCVAQVVGEERQRPACAAGAHRVARYGAAGGRRNRPDDLLHVLAEPGGERSGGGRAVAANGRGWRRAGGRIRAAAGVAPTPRPLSLDAQPR